MPALIQILVLSIIVFCFAYGLIIIARTEDYKVLGWLVWMAIYSVMFVIIIS